MAGIVPTANKTGAIDLIVGAFLGAVVFVIGTWLMQISAMMGWTSSWTSGYVFYTWFVVLNIVAGIIIFFLAMIFKKSQKKLTPYIGAMYLMIGIGIITAWFYGLAAFGL